MKVKNVDTIIIKNPLYPEYTKEIYKDVDVKDIECNKDSKILTIVLGGKLIPRIRELWS